jgi:S-adenosylmethionine decarboxylase
MFSSILSYFSATSSIQEKNPVGTHLILNLYDVSETLLTDIKIGKPLLDKIVKELKLTVVSETGHQFQPYGYTYAFVLSESHFTIHTYPELKSCYIDIFCCNKEFNPKSATNFIKFIFNTDSSKSESILR